VTACAIPPAWFTPPEWQGYCANLLWLAFDQQLKLWPGPVGWRGFCWRLEQSVWWVGRATPKATRHSCRGCCVPLRLEIPEARHCLALPLSYRLLVILAEDVWRPMTSWLDDALGGQLSAESIPARGQRPTGPWPKPPNGLSVKKFATCHLLLRMNDQVVFVS